MAITRITDADAAVRRRDPASASAPKGQQVEGAAADTTTQLPLFEMSSQFKWVW